MTTTISQTVTTLCSTWTAGCLSTTYTVAEWAAWIQAVGSVAAILVAVLVAQHQTRVSKRTALAEQRGHEILMCTRALLVCEGFLVGLVAFNRAISSAAPGEPRWRVIVSRGEEIVILPMDIDSLAFLVVRKAQRVLNDFSEINANSHQLNVLTAALHAFVKSAPRAVVDRAQLAARCRDIERFVNDGVDQLPGQIDRIRSQVMALYPEAVLPAAKRRELNQAIAPTQP